MTAAADARLPGGSVLTFHLIAHTHWDREWYAQQSVFQARLVPVIDDMLRLLAREDAARFTCDGQTILVGDTLDVMPELEPAIRAAASSGRLELGPWYVLADELIPGAESLVRNLLEGARDARRLGGRMDVCYCPDSFGHPGMLPAIAAGFRIRRAVVWRGVDAGQVDADLLRWMAPDGSSLLTHHLPRGGYEVGALLADGDIGWPALRDTLVSRARTSHVAVFVGADHHAAPASMTAIRDRIALLEPGHRVRLSSLGEYFAAVDPECDNVPTLRGEQRASTGHTWALQGVHATRSRMKRAHADAELHLTRHATPMVALAHVIGAPGALPAVLRRAWRHLLAAQFHDTIAGTVADDVAHDQDARLRATRSMSDEIARVARLHLLGHSPDHVMTDADPRSNDVVAVWNPVPRDRGGVLVATVPRFVSDVIVGPPDGRKGRVAPGGAAWSLRTADGVAIPLQVLSIERSHERRDAVRHYPDQDQVDLVRVALDLPPVGGLGWVALTVGTASGPLPQARLQCTTRELRNAMVHVTVGDTGVITLEDLRTGECHADLFELIDECDCGDTYTPHIRADVASTSGGTPLSRASLPGALVGSIEVGWRMPSAGSGDMLCHLRVTLHADSPVVRLHYAIDNCATDHRLRARLGVGAVPLATAGAAFGVERRPVQSPTGHRGGELPVPTAPAHRWVAVGDAPRALAVLQPGCFEYELTPDGSVLITMLRSVGELSRHDLRERPGHAAWPMATPTAQEPGWHEIHIGVTPLATHEALRPDALTTTWEECFTPLTATTIRDFNGDACAAASNRIALEGDGLVFSIAKPCDEGAGIVLRCYNVLDTPVRGRWVTSMRVRRATQLRLDETVLHELAIDSTGGIAFDAGAREVITIRLELMG